MKWGDFKWWWVMIAVVVSACGVFDSPEHCAHACQQGGGRMASFNAGVCMCQPPTTCPIAADAAAEAP